MTEQQQHNPATESASGMPSTLDMVREAVDSFAVDKSRSSVLQVDRQMMIDVGLIVVDPERPIGDGLRVLAAEFGEGAISQSAYYRWASELRDRYQSIESKYRERALRLAELAIDQATGGRQDTLATVLKTHMLRLAAERAVTAQDLEAIGGKSLGSIIALLDGHTQATFKRQEIEIKHQDAERKAAKLEADLARAHQQVEALRLKNQQRERDVAAQQQKQTQAVAAAESAAKGGASADEVVHKVRGVLGLGETINYFLPYQQAWIDDSAQVAMADKSRRIGFSYAESYRSVERRVRLGTDHLFASRTKADARGFIDYCKMWARVFNVVAEDLGEQVIDEDTGLQAFTLRFANGAKIVALSSHADAFRSYGGDVTLDEFAFHKDQRGVLKSARASAVIWGHQLRIISTHNGEGSFYNQLIKEIRAGKRDWSLHSVTLEQAVAQGLAEKIRAASVKDPQERRRIEATPDLDYRQQFIEMVRRDCVTLDEWMEEYCCIPNSDASAYLTYDLIDGCVDPTLRLYDSISDLPQGESIDYFAGYDIGRRRDLSVLWVWQIVGDVYWLRLMQRLTGEERKWSSQERLLDTLMQRRDVRRLAGDQTGMGEQLMEQRQDRWGAHRVEGVLLTAPRKLAIAGPFKALYEDKRCRIVQDDALRESLHKTRKTVTAAGNVRLHAESDEDGHADEFWAGASATEASSSPSARTLVGFLE